MKRALVMILLLCVMAGLTGCAKPVGEVKNASEQTTGTVNNSVSLMEDASFPPESDVMDICNVDGLTVHMESMYLTKDYDGNDIAALECLYTNDNSEPVAFNSGIIALMFFQDGVELYKNGMVLDDDYDWASAETSIKNGATISVFSAVPLRNATSPVEVDLILYSIDGSQHVKATRTFEIVK